VNVSHLRLGAVHREAPALVPHLASLIKLPAAAPSRNWHAACDWGVPIDMLGNDTYGDCVEVYCLQVLRMLTSNIWGRDSWTPTKVQALALYTANTTPAFNPIGPANDNGTDVVRFMSYWASKGIRLTDQTLDVCLWTQTTVADAPEAIDHTGPIGLTLSLPVAAQDMTNWAKAPGTGADWLPGSWGGHQVPVGRYDSDGAGGAKVLTCVTWAAEQAMHPDFVAKYAQGWQAPLSRLLLGAAGVSPNGLNWDEAMAVQRQLAA
jgi:hypothetical protein